MLTFHVPAKLQPFLKIPKRYKIAVGGRGSGKSHTIANMLIYLAAQHSKKICSMREYQSSIEDSSYSLFVDQIDHIGVPDFKIQKNYIDHASGGGFRFKGLARSIQSVKSFHGFDIFHIEEAQFLSTESIQTLTPTLRAEGSEFWMAMNPGSSEDPVSRQFLNFCWDELQSNGYYEDDLHLIIMINYYDNPMFPSVLEQERCKDKINLAPALYEHIWLGQFNDSVENSLIQREWFDACVDAHVKLGIEPVGLQYSSHDPSDTGPDPKAFAHRHGILITDLQEMTTGNVNEGGHWATGLAAQHKADAFTWDCDGMGCGLAEQVSREFIGKAIMFKGSEGVDNPDAIFEPTNDRPVQDQKTNKQVLRNKRAQYYYELRKRIYDTYDAVVNGSYHDPTTLISFDSTLPLLSKLRSELCRLPVKPNGVGLFELYTKDEMKRKFKMASPNLADSVMMLMRTPIFNLSPSNVVMPRPIRPMGRR